MNTKPTTPETSPNSGEEWVWLARIKKSQGRKGEVLAELLTDFPDKFTERTNLWLLTNADTPNQSAREIGLIGHFLHKGHIVLHFAGIDSIEKAETLRDKIVAIPKTQRTPLAEDEVYISDLIGCTLIDTAQNPPIPIGQIEAVDRESGPVALLVVNIPSNKEEILIPFAKAYLRKIDLEAKQVEMSLPEGLIEAQLP